MSMLRHYLALWAVLGSASLTGCTPCSTASDCPDQQLCRLGECVARDEPGPSPDARRDAGRSGADAGPAAHADAGSDPADAGRPDSGLDYVIEDYEWPRVETGTTARLYAVWGEADDDVWAVGAFGTILRYDGARWSSVPSGTRETLFDVDGAGEAVFAVGTQGTLLSFEQGAWQKIAGPSTTEAYRAVHVVSETDVWLVGPRGRALHFDGEGVSEEQIGVEELLLDVTVDASGDVWAVGPRSTAARRHDGAWSVIERNDYGRRLWRVQALGDRVIAAGEDYHFGWWDGERFALYQGSFLPLADLSVRRHTDGSARIDTFSSNGAMLSWLPDGGIHYLADRPDVRIEGATVLPSGTVWMVGASGITLRGPEPGPDGPLFTPGRLPPVDASFESSPGRVEQIEASTTVTCLRRSDGKVACAGDRVSRAAGFHELAQLDRAVDLAVAEDGACVLRDDRQVRCRAFQPDALVPIVRPYDFDRLFSGAQQICGRVPASRTVDCFEPDGDEGDGLLALEQGVASLDRHGDFVCAVEVDGTVRCRANSYYYRAGLGEGFRGSARLTFRLPEPVHAQSVSLSRTHACAVALRGVWCWGDNANGQLGDGTVDARSYAVRVPAVTDAATVTSGGGSTCAARTDGAVWCWGSNHSGRLGDGSDPVGRASPGLVPGLADVVELTSGLGHFCALRRGGQVSCWGANTYGQLGDGTHEDRTTPVEVYP